jgi:hypothetical protein
MQPGNGPPGIKSMRHPKALAAWLTALLLLTAAPALAQVDAFRLRAARVPKGKVLHYVKSQLDGTHAARISVYVANIDLIEALKWDEGGEEATLVTAAMDWSRFSVRRFEAWHLVRGRSPERRATLTVEGEELRTSLMDRPLRLQHWPWHSYDFDFTSLNLALPHLNSPRGEVRFWRTDFVHGDPPRVAELGEVLLRFSGRDTRRGVAAFRYDIDGSGLDGRRGRWWVDAESGLTLEHELPLGDEPGYRDVRLRLSSIEPMAPAQWEALKLAAVAGS